MEQQPPVTLPTHVIALNYFTIIFIASGIGISYLTADTLGISIALFASWLYLLPPLFARVIIAIRSRPCGIVRHDSSTHNTWWALFQLQLVFNRFPFLEEVLRVIPGLYALWLNLWGAKVSSFVFWSPGVVVMDRYHLHIDKGAILGSECMISGHVLKVQEDGSILLAVDQVRIESGALIGARASITPGCHIHAFETAPAGRILRPYTRIKDGKKEVSIPNTAYNILNKNS